MHGAQSFDQRIIYSNRPKSYAVYLSKASDFRATCDSAFEGISEKERVYKFSTPKAHRLLKVLKTYTPTYSKDSTASNGKYRSFGLTIRSCRQLLTDVVFVLDVNVKSNAINRRDTPNARDQNVRGRRFGNQPWKHSEDGFRKMKSLRYLRNITDPDLLCGVIFVDKALTAKILFYLLNVCVG